MKVALTGGIAEGKSTVLSYLSQEGIPVVSSDDVAREVFSEPYIQREISALVGVDEAVSPSDLRAALSANRDLRRSINRLMHPVIMERLEESSARVIEVPLLIETCTYGRFDTVWVVTCGREEQRRRLVARVGDEALADRLLASQLNTAIKLPFADEIIRTNSDEESVKRCVMMAVHRSL